MGWSLCMCMLFAGFAVATRLYAQDSFLALLLEPFGVKKSQKKEAEFAALWLFGVMSLLGALAGGFIAVWFGAPHPMLECTLSVNAPMPSPSLSPSPSPSQAVETVLSTEATVTCGPNQYIDATR